MKQELEKRLDSVSKAVYDLAKATVEATDDFKTVDNLDGAGQCCELAINKQGEDPKFKTFVSSFG